jgi:hypothetical protein
MNVWGMILPAAVSLGIVYACHRGLPRSAARRYALAVAVAVGVLAGSGPQTNGLPTQHRDWIPFLALGTAALAPLALARGVFFPERWVLSLILAIVAAEQLVPDWESLQPARTQHVGFLSLYLFLLLIGLPPLADQLSTRMLLAIFTIAAAVLAGMVLVSVSVLYAQTGGLLVMALVGCCLATFWYGDAMQVRGLAPVWAIIAGGLAFVAYIEPEPPLEGLLLLPAAPLASWLTRFLPRPNNDRLATIVSLLPVALAMGAGIGWVLLEVRG